MHRRSILRVAVIGSVVPALSSVALPALPPRPFRGDRLRRRPTAIPRRPGWALDFQFDQTADGRRLKLLNVVDEHTRQALALHVGRRADADTVVEVLTARRGAPRHLRMDNGPELIAWALRDCCRLGGTDTVYIEPGSPWQNPYVESFSGRVRDELLNVEEFGSLTEAQVVIEAWRTEYNTYRPHSALDGLTPDEYHRQWTNQKPTTPS